MLIRKTTIQVIVCPHCNHITQYRQSHCYDHNQTIWTDGKGYFFEIGLPWIVQCPYCKQVYRPAEAKEVGRFEKPGLEPAQLFPEPGWEEAYRTQMPSEAGYYQAICNHLVQNRSEEISVRLNAWYRHNDPYRHCSIGEQLGGYVAAMTDDDVVRIPVVTPACQENLELLLTLLDEPERSTRIIKGEVLRQLGRIEEAEALVARYRYKAWAHQIWMLCQKGDTLVRMVDMPKDWSRLI